jgi:hypothetical protein
MELCFILPFGEGVLKSKVSSLSKYHAMKSQERQESKRP